MVSYDAAMKVGPLRDAAGGAVVLLQHLPISAYPLKPDLDHVLVLVGNVDGAICARILRLVDVKRAQRLATVELSNCLGDMVAFSLL